MERRVIDQAILAVRVAALGGDDCPAQPAIAQPTGEGGGEGRNGVPEEGPRGDRRGADIGVSAVGKESGDDSIIGNVLGMSLGSIDGTTIERCGRDG